jgi:hypothetical protein
MKDYRDNLISLVSHWKRDPGIILLGVGKIRAGDVAGWIRRLTEDAPDADSLEVKNLISQLDSQLGRSEQQVREISLDRDRWRRRANEAEALIKSSGVSAATGNRRTYQDDRLPA